MEDIIKKAIEGGYEKERYYFDENGNFDDEPYEVVLMKSSFWQALSKACGWDKREEKKDPMFNEIRNWKYYAIRFPEINLTPSWDKAIQYLSNLIKEN